MPLVNVPGVGRVNFPDTMSREEIIEAIERDILPSQSGAVQQAPAASQMEPVPERGLFGTIGARFADVGGSLVSGAGSVATGVGGLGGILGVTGYDNVLTRLGRRGAEFGAELMSPELRNQRRALADAMKEAEERGLAAEAGAALSTLATNPGLLASMAVEQIPAFILSGGVGRAATAVGQIGARGAARAGTTAVDRAGQAGAIGTAASLQTGGIADETYREVMGLSDETLQASPNYQRLLQSMSPAEAKEAIANRAAREAGLMGGGISIAAMTALPSAEKALFTRGISQSAVRRALGVGTAEATSEGIEEGGGRFGQNLAIQRQADPERDLLRGVGGAAATGAVLGGVMGAGVGALQRPADPGAGERPDLQRAIADIVAGREPEPQAPGLLPRETRIETPVGDLTRYQLSQYMERMLPGLMQSSPELASMMSYARNENDRLDIFRNFLAERQEGLARGRQGSEAGRIREEIATSPQTRSAFEIAAAREGRAVPGAADLRAGAPAAASPRLVLNPSFDRRTGRLTAGEAITRVGEISPDGNLTVYVERQIDGRLTEVPVRANQDQIYSIPMLESPRMTQEAAQVRIGPEQVAGRRGVGVDPFGLSMSPRRVTDRTESTIGGSPIAEPRQPEAPAPRAQAELPVQPQVRTEPPSIIPPVEPVSQADAERPTQTETFNIPIGRQFSVSTPDGSMNVDVVPEIVDLFSLTPATGGLQNRMIENPANQTTINEIANKPDFSRLGTSPYSDRGAPIIGPDNVIEIGNHRVEGLKRGAENNPEAFQRYVKALNDAGYDTSGMRFPVLIRRRIGNLSPEQRQDFTRLSNGEANQTLSDLEIARQDASRLTPELLAKFDGEVSGGVRAAKNIAFAREFMSQITTPSERTRLVTPEGGISDAFADRLERALFASAYNDIGLIKRAVESGDDDSKSITGGMVEATGAMQELRRGIEAGRIRPEFGIVDALVKAADRIRAGKANGLTPGDILATEDMLNPIPPLERELVKLFANDNLTKIASKSAIGKRLKAFVEEAKTQTTDVDLVGGERRITPEEAAVVARNPGQASMFSARRAGAAEAQAAPESEEAAPNQDRAREIVNKYLAELRAMGRQGRLIANSLENLLRDRTMNANQIYQAFMVGETLAKTLPSKADYKIRFLQDLIVDNEQAGAASGAKVGERAQGRVIYPTDSLPGFIELSLAEDMLPLLRETAAHEAFHVLQSYFSSYDANFAERINKFFKDGMTIADLEPSIKRRLQGMRIPGQKISYYAALAESLGDAPLSAKEAQAYAFGALIDAANRGQKVTALIPSFQRFITFARDFFGRMKRGLTGDGFTAPADILTEAQQRGAAMEQRAPVVEGQALSARVTDRDPALEEAARGVREGTTTREQYEQLVNERKPVLPYEQVPEPATREQIVRALELTDPRKVSKVGVPSETLKRGDLVGLRLDIPAYSKQNTWVVSVHEAKGQSFYAGTSIGYEPTAIATDVQLGVVPGAAMKIAAGDTDKATIAVMRGKWVPATPEQAKARADEAMSNPAWVQVGMDPRRHQYFYDRTSREPIVSAEEVIQIGPLVLAKNPTYASKANYQFSARKPLNSTYASFSKELSGPIVYQDPYVALIEATDGNGDPLYIGARASGTRTLTDIEDYTGNMFRPEEKRKLIEERRKRVDETQRLAIQNPKGPFKNGNVAFDESYPENLRGFSEGILRELGLSDEKVFFTTFRGAQDPDFNERNELFGDYYGVKSMGFYQKKHPGVYGLAKNRQDGKYRAIAINDSKRLSVQIETVAHEIGHVFDYAALTNAPDQTFEEIQKSFSQWMRKNDRKSGKEYIRLLRTPVVGKEFARNIPEVMTARDLSQYSRSFSEWFADQVARWSLTSEPAKTLIGRFFQRIAAAYRKIVNAMGAAGLPDQTVAKFIEAHRDRQNIQIPAPPKVKAKKPVQTSFDFSARRVPEYAARAAAQPAPKDFFEAAKAKINTPSVFDRALAVLLDKKKGETIGQAFARTSINRAAPLYNLDEIARAGGYTGRSAAKAMELSLQNTGRMAQLLTSGMGRIDPKTGAIKFRNDVKPLFEIMEGAKLKTEQLKDEFQAYLAALRERDLRARNRQGFFNTTDAQVKDWITKSEAAHPEWKTAAAELDKLNNALVDWALDTGLVTKQQSNTLRDVFYTPFYRLIDKDNIEDPTRSITPRIGESFTNVASAINREMKGGTKPLGDLYENIIRNADSIMKAGLKNLAMRQAAETMEFAKLGKKTNTKDPDNTITYKVDGKDVLFEVGDAALFSALAGMPRTMQNGIYDTMAKLAGFFRDMVTIAPSFMLANLWRGKVSAYVQEGQPFMTNTFAGLRDALNASSSLRNFQLQTGFGGMEYGMGERNMASAFDSKMTDEGITKALMKGNAWSAIRQAYGKMQELSEATEMAERIKLAENLMKKGVNKEDAEFQAYLLAPYSRRGTGQGWVGHSLQFFMPLVPFLNAKLQTTYRLFENEKGDKRKLWTLGIPQQIFLRGLVVTAFSLMAYAANLADDEEKWDSIPSHMKLNYDIIPFMGDYITLPRAFEIGQVFGALPIFVLDAIRRGEGRDLTGALIEVGLNTFWMNPTPKAIDPIFAVWTNYDFFRGKPLETLAEQNLPVAERVNRSTTSVGKGLSEAVNVVFGRDVLSPIRAQALLDGYTGTLGVTLMSGFDSALAAAGAIPGKPAGAFGELSGAANLVGLNRFYREDATMVSRFVGDFYKIKEMTDQLVRSQNLARETRDFNRLEELRGEAGLPLQLRTQVNRASEQISDLNKRITRIERSTEMDGVAKTEALEPLIRRRDQIAKAVVDRARGIGAF